MSVSINDSFTVLGQTVTVTGSLNTATETVDITASCDGVTAQLQGTDDGSPHSWPFAKF